MPAMQEILRYLKAEYRPLAVVVYGSFASGTNDACSDFDCIVITDEKPRGHDDAVIGGTMLDCFIYTREEIAAEDLDPFLPIFDGQILMDTDGLAAGLQERVLSHAAAHAVTPEEDKEFLISWIRKTMRRAEKGDDEGSYRALMFLSESLSDYFALRDMFYFGSKKGAAWLRENDPAGHRLYHAALTERTDDAIRSWAAHVTDIR